MKVTKYFLKDKKTKSMLYACYFILNPKEKTCTPENMQDFINRKKSKTGE